MAGLCLNTDIIWLEHPILILLALAPLLFDEWYLPFILVLFILYRSSLGSERGRLAWLCLGQAAQQRVVEKLGGRSL